VDIETSDVPVNCDVVISDGGALIQSLTSEPSCSTFGDCSSVAFAARVRHELENIPNKLHKEKLFDVLTNEATKPGLYPDSKDRYITSSEVVLHSGEGMT